MHDVEAGLAYPQTAEEVGDVARVQTARGDLVQQRLEGVVDAAIDERHPYVGVTQGSRRWSGEAAADDDHVRPRVARRVRRVVGACDPGCRRRRLPRPRDRPLSPRGRCGWENGCMNHPPTAASRPRRCAAARGTRFPAGGRVCRHPGRSRARSPSAVTWRCEHGGSRTRRRRSSGSSACSRFRSAPPSAAWSRSFSTARWPVVPTRCASSARSSRSTTPR